MPPRALLFGLLLIGGLGCSGAAPSSTPASDWSSFVETYLDGYFALYPTEAVDAGRHEFDGRLPDWSPAGLARSEAWLREQRAAALAFDSTALDEQQRFERRHLVATIDGKLFWEARAEWPYRNPSWYSGPLDPDVYLSRPYAPLAERLRAYTAHAEAIPAALGQLRANLRTPLPRTYVTLGLNGARGMATYLRDDVPGVFAGVEDAALRAHFGTANARAAEAFDALAAWYEAQQATATDDYAIGADRFREMLWATERVDVPLDRLEAAGRADMARNRAALEEACAAFAPGETLRSCTERARGNKPEGSPVEAARRQLGDLRAFLVANDVVTIPGPEEAQVGEAPPYQRWNFAYIKIPGPYEENLPSVYYISPPDPTWTPEEQHDYLPGRSVLEYVSVHEVWPGHFLQFLHANRSPSTFGRVFVGYAFAEGWAHYTEEMMWEAGLSDGDPEGHVGQLLNALRRNARYLSALGLHTGGMTVEESERLFRDEAFQDAGNARQQAARGTFDPAYLNYTLGKLMIMKLREDWTGSRGGRAAWRDFHDRFLSSGGPPIPLVREAMLGPWAGPAL